MSSFFFAIMARAKGDCPRHVRNIRLGGQPTNNKMERLNGEIRDREKVMRGLNYPELKLRGFVPVRLCIR